MTVSVEETLHYDPGSETTSKEATVIW